jgi:putative oxidoreductase
MSEDSMSELKFLTERESTGGAGDWVVRGGVACIFFVFGLEKFSADPSSHWVTLFHQIGAGDWFRNFTGAVEILGALLVLVPRSAIAGLVLLAATMAAAVLILVFVLGRPAESVFPGVFFIGLVVIIVIRRQTGDDHS